MPGFCCNSRPGGIESAEGVGLRKKKNASTRLLSQFSVRADQPFCSCHHNDSRCVSNATGQDRSGVDSMKQHLGTKKNVSTWLLSHIDARSADRVGARALRIFYI